jgi:hypothetical protein
MFSGTKGWCFLGLGAIIAGSLMWVPYYLDTLVVKRQHKPRMPALDQFQSQINRAAP